VWATLDVSPRISMNTSDRAISAWPAMTTSAAHPLRRTSPAAMKARIAKTPSLATELATKGNSISSLVAPCTR
jgi:hypothetical protein